MHGELHVALCGNVDVNGRIFCVFACCLLTTVVFLRAAEAVPEYTNVQTIAEREMALKVAFIYNFLLFTEWPASANESGNFSIGVIGSRKAMEPFLELERNAINQRAVVVTILEPKAIADADFSRFSVVYISSDSVLDSNPVLEKLKRIPALTISDDDGFLKKGGMIRIFSKENHLRFEINLAPARFVGISFRSRLLRLASKVIDNAAEQKAVL